MTNLTAVLMLSLWVSSNVAWNLTDLLARHQPSIEPAWKSHGVKAKKHIRGRAEYMTSIIFLAGLLRCSLFQNSWQDESEFISILTLWIGESKKYVWSCHQTGFQLFMAGAFVWTMCQKSNERLFRMNSLPEILSLARRTGRTNRRSKLTMKYS